MLSRTVLPSRRLPSRRLRCRAFADAAFDGAVREVTVLGGDQTWGPMPTCRKCGADLPDSPRFCPACGAASEVSPPARGSDGSPAPLGDVTAAIPPPARVEGRDAGRGRRRSDPDTASSRDTSGRFRAGTLLGERYRIVSLLGRGGMGEVYRADDLTLGESVALKFLPERRSRGQDWLARVREEVRITRQVTHPNVCRVHDIGESSGETYIAMEYIDGEDLSSLLRRIGRFPRDRAVKVAREICAGLAAAHERGVLHRDLKPANVMIDGRGRARITDFGLAAIDEGEGATDGLHAGTPAYMAPEQLDGAPATVRSDIWSLGLILYELFTGERAVRGSTIGEIREHHRASTPTPMSRFVADIDPAVERVIERCLDPDPAERPGSVLAIAAALPGGDPLAAALAAGETPSPEMVAESGRTGGLRPAVAVGLVLAAIGGLAALSWLSSRVDLLERVPLRPAASLRDEVASFLASIGDTVPDGSFVSFGFNTSDHFERLQAEAWRMHRDAAAGHGPGGPVDSSRLWRDLDRGPPVLHFWWRSSPELMTRHSPTGRMSYEEPPHATTGMRGVVLGSAGGLIEYRRVPPGERGAPPEEEARSESADWTPFFAAARLDGRERTELDRGALRGIPPIHCDGLRGWIVAAGRPEELPLRVEAGWTLGRPVWFRVSAERSDEERAAGEGPETPDPTSPVGRVIDALILGVVLAGIWLALRNLRAGRGDRLGARRIGIYMLIVMTGRWFFFADFPLRTGFFYNTDALSNIAMAAILAPLFYLAVEPFARRYWPRVIVSWTRLVRGRFRDPLVGRDLLFGVIIAVGLVVWEYLVQYLILEVRHDGRIGPHLTTDTDVLIGARQVFASICNVQTGLVQVFAEFVFLLFLRIVTGRTWLAALLFGAIYAILLLLLSLGNTPLIGIVLSTPVEIASFLWLLTRIGLLGFAASSVAYGLLFFLPVTWSSDPGYGEAAWVAPILVLALAAYGGWVSMAGRPLLRAELLDPAPAGREHR